MFLRSAIRCSIGRVILAAAVCALFGAPDLLARPQTEQLFKGRIAQCSCDQPRPLSATESGASVPLCPPPCAKRGVKFFLLDAKTNAAFDFDKEDYAKVFVGRDVYVIGIMDSGTHTIRVNNVIPDVAPKIRQAKAVSIVCDACPRAMAKTRGAAYEQLVGWGRYFVLPDTKNAELIVLISANPYLGDYVTRDGPDPRPVSVETVYMNVVDPRTGESLWGDSEKVGSWFVVSATKDLVDELRDMVEAEESPVARKGLIARDHIYRVATNQGK